MGPPSEAFVVTVDSSATPSGGLWGLFLKGWITMQPWGPQMLLMLKRVALLAPHVPNFRDPLSVSKFLGMSFLLVVVYSLNEAGRVSAFPSLFAYNLQAAGPQMLLMLLLLFLAAPLLSVRSPFMSMSLIGLSVLASSVSCYFWEVIVMGDSLSSPSVDELGTRIMVSMVLALFALMYFDWREKSLHPAHLQAKLSALQAKMRPHFLFNTLNSIMALIKRDPAVARQMLLNLSELLRASLKDDPGSFSNLAQEKRLCDKYIAIEAVRLKDRLRVDWILKDFRQASAPLPAPTKIDALDDTALDGVDWDGLKAPLEDVRLPSLTLQPLVENAVLHGVQHRAQGGTITIEVHLLNRATSPDGAGCLIRITNPCEDIALDADHYNQISHINIQERLKILFGKPVPLDIRRLWSEAEGSRFEVCLRLP